MRLRALRRCHSVAAVGSGLGGVRLTCCAGLRLARLSSYHLWRRDAPSQQLGRLRRADHGHDLDVLRARRVPPPVNFGLGLVHDPSGLHPITGSVIGVGQPVDRLGLAAWLAVSSGQVATAAGQIHVARRREGPQGLSHLVREQGSEPRQDESLVDERSRRTYSQSLREASDGQVRRRLV